MIRRWEHGAYSTGKNILGDHRVAHFAKCNCLSFAKGRFLGCFTIFNIRTNSVRFSASGDSRLQTTAMQHNWSINIEASTETIFLVNCEHTNIKPGNK
jgi:hypothetical protein